MNTIQSQLFLGWQRRRGSVRKGRSMKIYFGLMAALLFLGGCGAPGEAPSGSPMARSDAAALSSDVSAASPPTEGALKAASEREAGAPTNGTVQLVQMASAVPRKIIYNATVDLIADNFSLSESRLMALVKTNHGYIAEVNIGAAPGTPRQGNWKIRVPEAQFAAFMADVTKLGELQNTRTDSQDVTAQFTDLQARIANKQVEESRLIVLLQRQNAKLSEILQVERELSRVRGEIEQMQGQLRLLANQSALATVTVTLHEVKGYVAPKPTTFGSEISRTFDSSLGEIRDIGKGLVLTLVSIVPWLPLIALIVFPAWKISRHQLKKNLTLAPKSENTET